MLEKLKKHKLTFILSMVFLLLFIVLFILVKTVNKAEYRGDVIGLSDININLFEKLGLSNTADKITDFILIFSFLVGVGFFVYGLFILIKNKELDLSIIVLGGFYCLCLVIYILFDHIHINYAPNALGISIDPKPLKESFPSSHVLACVFLVLSGFVFVKERISNKKISYALYSLGTILVLGMVILRMFSGCHWFTDILGSIFLGMFLVTIYWFIALCIDNKNIKLSKKNEQ